MVSRAQLTGRSRDNLQIKSITAYRNVDSQFAHDGDSTPFYLSWVRDEIYKQEQFTQEIHLQGMAVNDRLQWIIGGFYFTGNNYNPVDFAGVDIESGAKFDHESIALRRARLTSRTSCILPPVFATPTIPKISSSPVTARTAHLADMFIPAT